MHHEFPHQCLNLWKSLPRTQGLWYLQFGLAVGLTGGGGHASPCLSCLFLIWGNLLLCVTDIGWPLFSEFFYFSDVCKQRWPFHKSPHFSFIRIFVTTAECLPNITSTLSDSIKVPFQRSYFFTHTVSTWSSFNASLELN